MSAYRSDVPHPRPLSEYRRALREGFGSHNYRIMRNDEIHVRFMGAWGLYGWVGDRDTEYRLFEREH